MDYTVGGQRHAVFQSRGEKEIDLKRSNLAGEPEPSRG